MKEKIIKKLQENLTIKKLEVINNSHLHADHNDESFRKGETHFEVIISAGEFKNKGLVASHRKIKTILKDEFEKNGLHSLSIKILQK